MSRLIASFSHALSGEVLVSGDKSISHRALILSALCLGTTDIEGLLESDDVLATLRILRALGVRIEKICEEGSEEGSSGSSVWRVFGAGAGAFEEPSEVLDCGNSGTSARLLCGLLAAAPFPCTLDGDQSLRARPMGRVLAPLAQAGVSAHLHRGQSLPLRLLGLKRPLPLRWHLEHASAQVKSALLLFALCAQGRSEITEPFESRDHTERMLLACGAPLCIERRAEGGRRLLLEGGIPLKAPRKIRVPGDMSSAAFLILAATLCEGSEVTLMGVGVNPTRIGFLETLREMGADITLTPSSPIVPPAASDLPQHLQDASSVTTESSATEPVANLRVRAASLRGVCVPADRVASMIDEYPALAMAAACAKGKTVMEGVAELRVKESDRLSAVVAGLARCGVRCQQEDSRLVVYGNFYGNGDGNFYGNEALGEAMGKTMGKTMGKAVAGSKTEPVSIEAYGDHRIAMSFLTLGLALRKHALVVDSAESIATSFPAFQSCLQSLGAAIAPTSPSSTPSSMP